MSICRKCGNVLPPNASACPYCGMPAMPQQPSAGVQAPTAFPGSMPSPQPGAAAPQNNPYPPVSHPAPFPGAPTPYGVPQYMPTAPAMPPQVYTAPLGNNAAYMPVRPTEPDGALSTSQYFWILILFMVPIIGLIFMLYWSFAADVPPARKRLARAFLIKTGILLGTLLILFGIWGSLLAASFRLLRSSYFRAPIGSYTAAVSYTEA